MKCFHFPLLLLTLALCLQFEIVHSEKILVLSFFSSKSHKITYERLIEELASRGHQITMVTPIKGDKEVKNIREIFTVDVEHLFSGPHNPFNIKEEGHMGHMTHMTSYLEGLYKVCRTSLELPEVKQLLSENFDLIFMQPMMNECALGLVHRLKAPLVLFSPISAPAIITHRVGGYLPLSFVPTLFLDYSDDMNFFQRFVNFGAHLLTQALFQLYHDGNAEKIYREMMGQDIPSVAEILGNASLVLSNGHFAVNRPKPFLPDVVDVGGIHSRPAKPLPKDLEEFVSKGKDGFIFFSMGSAIRGSTMPEEKRKMFLKVFSKLKQQVVWKWETETMPDLPKNVKLSKWLPQQDLLGHKGIKMFITHCGGGGLEESIYHGVPLLGMPMFGDQPMNAKVANSHGFLVQLEWADLTEESLMEGIQKLLTDNTYTEKVQRLSKIFKDQPDDPLERGVFWIEYVMRHKGAPQLQSAARKLNTIQYHSLDVIGAYLSIIFGSLYIVYTGLKLIVRKVCSFICSSKKVPVAKNKKNK